MAPSLGSPDSLLELLDNKKQTPITLEGGKLMVNGRPFLSEVPPCITLTPYSSLHTEKALDRSGCFIGFDSNTPKSRHVVSLGKLRGIRFMSLFRFKVWWTTHWVGDKGSDLEYETQIVILDKSDSGRPYVLLLPLIEQAFRSSLQPGEDDNVDICVESGSTLVMGSTFRSSLYVHTGDNPYDLVKDAIKAVRAHLGTFKLLEEKTPPGIVDKFGWCTWDAFYLAVHPEGVWEGVKVLVEGGCPPGLVLIDDGWQSICHDDDPITDQEGMNRTAAGEQMPCRLIKVQENYKFRDYKSKLASTMASPNENHVDENGGGHKSHVDKGLGAFVRDLKSSFKTVEHVYVWHALCGYWGGIRPQVPGMPNASLVTPKLSPGLQMTMEDLAVDKIVNNGIGLVPPEQAYDLYDGLHAHLASNGIDGVKVDVIHVLEMLSEDYGGRVNLAKAYYKAISASVKKHFKGNGVIASMEHCNDFMFLGTEAISLGRVGDDFWCADESGDRGNPSDAFWLQGCHMVHCSYNSLWMGNFIHPDWDMFQSVHPCAAFHAASRVISGGPIYISDAIGKHDFQLLKSLVLPDGSILRCEFYALPTRDCLFESPLLDGKTMLKIWNLNKVTGVVGAFNCQGGGWCRKERKNRDFSEFSRPVKSTVNPNSIEWKNGKLSNWSIEGIELFAVYLFKAKQLVLLRQEESVEISLEPFDFELFTVSPVKIVSEKRVEFAPIGLVNMLNSGGAIQSANYGESSVEIEVKGAGELRVFSSEKPETCQINGKEVGFVYDVDRMVVIEVTWPDPLGVSLIEYLF